MDIKMRNFNFEVQRKDGTKVPFSEYTGRDKVNIEMKILGVIDMHVMTDTCNEARQVLEYIGNLK